MIPRTQIIEWRQIAPWEDAIQVEQDLILSRIIVEIFSDPLLSRELAFRGGTALHKLFFKPAARYSEDIDLVRVNTGAIKPIVVALHNRLDHWLGEPRTQQNNASFKMRYHFNPEDSPNSKQNIKIEINTRECFSHHERSVVDFSMQSDWFTGQAQVNTFQFEELIATKLRVLYQRKKGRDLFDLWLAMQQKDFDVEKVVNTFNHYMEKGGNTVTKLEFEKNLDDKLQDSKFMTDIDFLLSPEIEKKRSVPLGLESGGFFELENGAQLMSEGWDLHEAAEELKRKMISLLI